ncbi:MAG: D-2-hydroxyacid dehydrogenase [Peptoanaerobacter stomatis]|uniref:D-2-hydroxyacid dehydrogenase n=1 Tax=Peptoanaerobacter stomatis TaxID=796937 RepID=UPI003F9FEC98
MKIVVLDSYSIVYNDLSFDFLKDYDASIYDFTSSEEVVSRIGDAEAVFTSKCEINKDVIDSCPNLKFIGELATGYNNIDVKYCKEKNIIVSNIPSYASNNVSEMVFAFLLDVFYNLHDYDVAIKEGEWINSKIFTFFKHTTHNLAGKTIGIIGYGDIAKSVEKKAIAFDMNVLVHRRTQDTSDKKFVSLDYLLANSDIITVHTPLTTQTAKLINEESISKMKDGVVFVNTSRGGIVDEKALYDALESGKIAHACLDVLTKEPMEKDNILLKAKNITMTPHIAWAAYETRKKLIDILEENLKAYVSGKPINVVNK